MESRSDKLLKIVIVVFLICSLAMSVFIVSRSFKGEKQRLQTQQLIKTLQDQNNRQASIVERFECILLINPDDRTPQSIQERCAQ